MKKLSLKMLALVLLAISLQNCGTQTDNKDNTNAQTTNVSNTPKTGNFENFEVEKKVFTFDVSQAQTFVTEKGTKINFSADNFVDKNGNLIKGKVTITLREFHTLADVMASGIQMQYDSAGIKHNFESAGMFDLRGKQGNNDIFIAKNKPVKVALASFKNGNFNQYYLDQSAQKSTQIRKQRPQHNWLITSAYAQEMPIVANNNPTGTWKVTMTSQKPTINEEKMKALTELENKFKDKFPIKPIVPTSYNVNEPVLDFKIENLKAFPELDAFQNVVWQYAGEKNSPKSPEKNEWIFKQTWTNIKLQSQNVPGGGVKYVLLLNSGNQNFEIEVTPCLRGMDLKTAVETFTQKNEDYKLKRNKTIQENEEIKKSFEKIDIQGDFTRGFEVQEFGIHNCDIIGNFSEPITAMIDFGKTSINKLFLISGKRIVVNFTQNSVAYIQKFPNFIFDAKNDSQIFATGLKNGKQIVYHFSKEDFAKLDKTKIKKEGILEASLKEVEVKNLGDLNALMQ